MIRLKHATAICFAIVLAGAVSAGVPLSAAAQEGGDITIVAIDTDKILEVHPAFIEAKKKFETEVQGIQKKLGTMNQEEQLQAQQKMQQDLQQRGQDLQKSALQEMKQDIQKIADEKGYDYVVDSNLLIVGGKNVTEEVLTALKQNLGAKGEGSKK